MPVNKYRPHARSLYETVVSYKFAIRYLHMFGGIIERSDNCEKSDASILRNRFARAIALIKETNNERQN